VNIPTQAKTGLEWATSRKGNPQCPECGDETVLRQRRSNGSSFYGCINYPTCTATVDAQKFSTSKGAMSQQRRTP
jgi:ssDNA-binding Zn-finger/Zn-ribbon topoisomerase 1